MNAHQEVHFGTICPSRHILVLDVEKGLVVADGALINISRGWQQDIWGCLGLHICIDLSSRLAKLVIT